MPQIGTLGAGNHFVEVDVVEEIIDPIAAAAFGLRPGQWWCNSIPGPAGSAIKSHPIMLKHFQQAVHRYGIQLPDRELVCAPMDSPEGEADYAAMCAAANYAFVNRQLLAFWVRRSFEEVLAPHTRRFDLHQVYDIAHNIAKIETHVVEGQELQLLVHRKGATRAFGPGFAELPAEYRRVGQPVLVPGSMGTASWVMAGTERSKKLSFGSSCHGAGRAMSRSQAKKTIWGGQLREELEAKGIVVRAGSLAGLAEEAPAAYKDVDPWFRSYTRPVWRARSRACGRWDVMKG